MSEMRRFAEALEKKGDEHYREGRHDVALALYAGAQAARATADTSPQAAVSFGRSSLFDSVDPAPIGATFRFQMRPEQAKHPELPDGCRIDDNGDLTVLGHGAGSIVKAEKHKANHLRLLAAACLARAAQIEWDEQHGQ